MTSTTGTVPLPYEAEEVERILGAGARKRLGEAYRWMVLGRTLDARMQALQRQGRVGFYGAATGQEAVNVGAALALDRGDWVFPGLREQLLALVRGHSLVRYLHHLFADAEDPSLGRQMPCHPTAREVGYVSMSSVIGTQISHAVGAAFAMKYRGERSVALAFFGDGATSANDFHAGLNFAAVLGVPIVFCCTNNQWAISVPLERQTAMTRLAEKGRAYGVPGERVDGTDVVAVHRAVGSALARARSGEGPSVIEFVLFRMTPHSTSDDPTRYQPSDWMERAVAHDPVLRLEEWLVRAGALREVDKRSWQAECDRLVRDAVREAESAPPPPADSLGTDVLAPAATSGRLAEG